MVCCDIVEMRWIKNVELRLWNVEQLRLWLAETSSKMIFLQNAKFTEASAYRLWYTGGISSESYNEILCLPIGENEVYEKMETVYITTARKNLCYIQWNALQYD